MNINENEGYFRLRIIAHSKHIVNQTKLLIKSSSKWGATKLIDIRLKGFYN